MGYREQPISHKNAYQFVPSKMLFCHSVEKQVQSEETANLVDLASTLQEELRWNTAESYKAWKGAKIFD